MIADTNVYDQCDNNKLGSSLSGFERGHTFVRGGDTLLQPTLWHRVVLLFILGCTTVEIIPMFKYSMYEKI